jgi:hypothetical protein
MRTFAALLFSPGELSIAFREGRTQRYVPSLRLYLFVSLIFFVLLSVSGIALMQFEVTVQPKIDVDKIISEAMRGGAAARNSEEVEAAIAKARREAAIQVQQGKGEEEFTSSIRFFAPIGSVRSKLTPAQRAKLMAQPTPPAGSVDTKGDLNINISMEHAFKVLATDPAALNGPLTTWIPRVLFLLLPLYALLMALFYVRKRKKFYLVDHFVFSLNVHTFAFVLLTLAVFLSQAIEGEWLGWTALAIMAVYGFIAMKRFYRQNWFWTSFKFTVISFIYFCFFLAPALALVLVAALSEV